ncbi:hypothetical protein [Streptomyces sp. bgisy154]|uniref:hypothetical protein n=1 Tax=Streptomyces sp. bgisy154 TaxID=3413794 RepID=UPI003D7147EE
MKREELLAKARGHMWAAWQLSSEELASQAAETLIGLGMLVPEGGAQELERLRAEAAELLDAVYGDAKVRLLHPVEHARFLHSALAAQQGRAETLDRLLREAQARVAELEALKPAAVQTCRVCGAGYTYGQPCSTCEFRERVAAEVSADGITRQVAPTQALRSGGVRAHAVWEDPHDGPLSHRYEMGRDMPETGGAK